MGETELKEWLATLSDASLEALEYKTEEALLQAWRSARPDLVEGRISSKIPRVKSAYYRELNSLVRRVEERDIDLRTFDREVTQVIDKNFRKAFALTADPAEHEEYLRGAVESEASYAKQMARELRDGSSRWTRQDRVQRYAQALDSVAWNAKVESMPDSVEIDWVLGVAEHCDDCLLVAANGPYSKDTLPTVPRAGDTACHSNCRCKLVFRLEADIEDTEESVYWMRRKEPSLSESFPTLSTDKGTVPSRAHLHLADLYSKVLYHARKMDEPGEDKGEHLRARNRALTDYVEASAASSPYRNPIPFDRPLSSRTVPRRVVDDIFRYSIDGKTLGLLKESLPQLLDRLDSALAEDQR